MSVLLIQGDARSLPLGSNSIDACVTDPPYGLEFMGVAWDTMRDDGNPRIRNEWGDFGSREHARTAEEAPRIRRNKGLALQAFSEEWAREVFRVAKPGAHLLAFGGTRTYHRLTCAIEDAGWEIRDCLSWLYGSGFPKSLNLKGDWQGWGTGLKPAHEPIVLARKPLTGTVAANVERWGTGAINVEACRVGYQGKTLDEVRSEAGSPGRSAGWADGRTHGKMNGFDDGRQVEFNPSGRWPPNLLLTHFFSPVMRLKGQTPDIIREVIGRHFNAYTRLSDLRSFKGHDAIQVGRRSEVLRPSVQVNLTEDSKDPESDGVSLSDLRQVVHSSEGLDQRRSPEVLRQGMQDETSKDTETREGRTIWKDAYPSEPGQDCQNQEDPWERSEGSESFSVEGRENDQRSGLCVSNDRHAATRSTSDGPQNEADGILHSGAPSSDGDGTKTAAAPVGSRSPQKRRERRQQAGKLSDGGLDEPQPRAPRDRARVDRVTVREPSLEVLAADLPAEWLGYFEPTGEHVACGPACVEGCPVLELDRQSGETSTTGYRSDRSRGAVVAGTAWGTDNHRSTEHPGDSGPASRFFPTFRYCPKADRAEREAGTEHLTRRQRDDTRDSEAPGANNPRNRGGQLRGNHHPTVKPVALMRWLVKLVTPPGGTVLDCFLGSGTTGVAAMDLGFNFLGIEREAEYLEIARARIVGSAPLFLEAAP